MSIKRSLGGGPDPKKIKIDDWPSSFKELENIHFRLNSYFTFLSSRKHVITTIDLLKPSVEKAIGRPLELVDVARVQALVPRDILFKYVDESQFVLEEKHFSWKDGYEQKESDIYDIKEDEQDKLSKQLLVFEFIDGDLRKSKTRSSYVTEIRLPVYTQDSIKKMIVKRNKKFHVAVEEFLTACAAKGEDPWDQLTKKAEKMVPKPKEYVDPIEEMVKNTSEPNANETRITIPELIQKLKETDFYENQIVENGQLEIEPRASRTGELDFELSPVVLEALRATKNIESFYSHQAEALNHIHQDHHVIISTSTSSGKSLIYQLPVITALELDPSVTSMYIFPTKALAQDQRRSLKDLLNVIPALRSAVVETYDGDTEKRNRDHVRSSASVIFTNPDMLHQSILPSHQYWRRFLCNLKYVVVDELHMYKGLFGSHVALVMRRLRRVCSMLGNNGLVFISCSATLKQPVRHMQDIFGLPTNDIVSIDEDGSPHGGKHIVAWNPPLIDVGDPLAGRKPFITETAKVLIEMVRNGVRTIVFCVVRKVVELLMKEIRYLLTADGHTELIGRIMSYRGGYSPSDRRKIEEQMFRGNLKAIISTNALELGIDIGSLDAVVMCGFPISIANFHQQSGRAGRRNNDSLTLLVGGGDPVSQYYMKHPEEFVGSNYPDLVLDFENVVVLEGHLQCAAFERPLDIDTINRRYFGSPELVKQVCESRLQKDADSGSYHCNSRFLPWPSAHVSIRAIEEQMYAVVDITNGRNVVIEEVEASRTSFTLYDGGIFIHQGLSYLVKEFNADEKYAKVERANVDWSTSQRDYTNVDPYEIERIRSTNYSDVPIYYGKILSTTVVFGFFKMDRDKKILDAVEVNNPPVLVRSKGIWIDIPRKALELIKSKDLNAAGGIHAAQHALMGVLPLYILSGLDEIQTECKAPEKEFAKRQTQRKRPARLIFYDNKGGQYGSGLSTKAFDNIDSVLEKSLQKLVECDCDWGCPNCCAASFCKENSLVLSKYAAIIILAVIIGQELDMDMIPMGPEPNMPQIDIETIIPADLGSVKLSPDLEIIDVRTATAPLQPVVKEEEDEEGLQVKLEDNPAVVVSEDEFSDDDIVKEL
ncbi:hypothetical protein OGAPHI_006523 [Ogataea philodendri]|uniref:Uncharacterized protein n=1 Tax=Ogataea philodendri TaxID=1378263 RepID=A0A9P8NWP9_9ASCO|nr:uncharacterized protein OGAPHI_006523 [Ogataea philodendri]KAH3661673.1 hypothetical protein OGAPHI_006523 [Ogataea philodendri]